MGWTQQTFQAELQRRCRIRFHLSTNDGSIEVSGTDHFDGQKEPDGWPIFLTRIQVSTGPYHFQAELNDRMLGHLVDLVGKFLDRPQPPVRVEVTLQQPRRRRRPKLEPRGNLFPLAAGPDAGDAEKNEIKARMLAGR